MIQWRLSVGLPHADTCYVKKLHPSDPSRTHQSGRQTWYMFHWMFEDRTLRRGWYVSVCHADLIHELYRKSVTVVQRWIGRMKRDLDVHALFWSDAALYWHHTEPTQPAVLLGSCGIEEQKILMQYQDLGWRFKSGFQLRVNIFDVRQWGTA